MKCTWSYKDIFDLEFFLSHDREKNQDELHRRDRDIYLSFDNATRECDRQTLLTHWLQFMREKTCLPGCGQSLGMQLENSLRLISTSLFIAALLAGYLSGLAFFNYSGTTPVNVFHFLIVFVFSQFLLLLIMPLIALIKIVGGFRTSASGAARFYIMLLASLTSRIQRRLKTTASATARDRYHQVSGLITQVFRKYGSLLRWPLFNLSQKIMIAGNIGLLAAIFFRLATSDLAFGWQSTIQITSPVLLKTVRFLALPWSWAVPENIAYPSLAAIEGSRIILKDGIYNLATQDLVAWWPFLVLCLVVYGLGTRVVLLSAALYLQRKNLARFKVKSADAIRIVQRMQTPLVSTQAGMTGSDKSLQNMRGFAHEAGTYNPSNGDVDVIFLITGDIAEQFGQERIAALLSKRGFNILQTWTVLSDFEADRKLLETMEIPETKSPLSFLLVFESWMPPIGDTLSFLKELRTKSGNDTPFFIGLLGRAEAGNLLLPPEPLDYAIWKQKLDALGDPNLCLLSCSDEPENPRDRS